MKPNEEGPRTAPNADSLPTLEFDRVTVADRYELRELLGKGAFGEVRKAYDRTLDREVAIKIVRLDRLHTLGSDEVDQVLAESRTIAKLDHPHVVPIFDAGVDGDRVWMATKLISGHSLRQVLREEGPMGRERSLEILRQVAEALSHAHRHGIVHRDVKPSNVLIATGEDGGEHAWLTDFGIAKVLTGRTVGSEDVVAGTPQYMAPEQITGKRVDARADVFALGCIAVELVTGTRAFPADSYASALYVVIHEHPRGMSDAAGHAGDDYVETIRRWLAKSPEDRRQSAEEVLRDVERLRRPRESRKKRFLQGFLRRENEEAPWDGRHVLEVDDLRKGYGLRADVLDGISLTIPTASVFALLGRNGSGKTTLIRTVLGFYRPAGGTARVFGRNPWQQTDEILARVGFVPEELYAYEWLRVSELLELVRSFYPSWDQAYVYKLLERFALPLDKKLRTLSRGMQTKVSLVSALAHRPELLVLDDPTIGLDAVVLEELVETLQEISHREGTTILLASHEYEQVERLATHVGFLKGGRLLLSDTLEHLKLRAREVELRFPDEPPDVSHIQDFKVLDTSGRRLRGVILDTSSDAMSRLRSLGPEDLEVRELGLREIFVNYLR